MYAQYADMRSLVSRLMMTMVVPHTISAHVVETNLDIVMQVFLTKN